MSSEQHFLRDFFQTNRDGTAKEIVKQELLENKVESDMKVSQAEREKAKAENEATIAKNESAIDRLLASNEKFRADIEKSVNSITTSITMRLVTGLVISVAFLSLVVAVTGLLVRT